MKIAVIGCGNWGKNIVRNFYNLEVLDTICDLNEDTLNLLKNRYQSIHTTTNYMDIVHNPLIHGVVVATQSGMHYKIAKDCLLAGKHVYVEKPLATSSKEAAELCNLATSNLLVLMVGHILLYHPAVRRLNQLVAENYLGKILYVQSERLSLTNSRKDKSVLWDRAPHDLSMIQYIINRLPIEVISAVGYSIHPDNLIDIAHVDLLFEDHIFVHVQNNWSNQEKLVKLMVIGSHKTAFLDDLKPNNKIIIYDNQTNSTIPDEFPDYIDIEPLKLECQHFLSCIQNQRSPRSDGESGYTTVKIIEKIEEKMIHCSPLAPAGKHNVLL